MKRISITQIKRRLWSRLVISTRESAVYPYIYRSYWHYLLNRSKQHNKKTDSCYYSARPNPGAGIGHQIANWNAGYWFAKQFGLKFAHIPFSSPEWDYFLGFGNGEPLVSDLRKQGYKIRKLPLFNEEKQKEIQLNEDIIKSYGGENVVFVAEQDQFYRAQYDTIEDLQRKFYSSLARKQDNMIYSEDNFNIAIHVRRGDIMVDQSNSNLTMRYLSNDYFEKVLTQVVENVQTSKPVHIYFFSQGSPEDYPEFSKFPNLHWCLTMNAMDTFLHFVFADLLITSKSSFSYKPALLNRGKKVCPRNFWHGYPDKADWILCENDGRFDVSLLKSV